MVSTLFGVKLDGNLWHHRDFNRLWISETISQFGNTFTQFAIPLLAVITFHADPFQVGLLVTLAFLPYPVLGLFVGVWADRFRRRRIMIACNAGRMFTVGSVPVSFLLGMLTFPQLYAVALVNGVLSVFFDVAYQSYLPSLVDRKDLAEGNQKLQISQSAAQVVGPSIDGVAYQGFGGALSMSIDALGYLASALSLSTIETPEHKGKRSTNDPRPSFIQEMKEGLRLVFGNPILWTIAGCTATSNFGSNIYGAVLVLFAVNMLHFTPVVLGLVGTIGALGFALGAIFANKFTQRVGVGVSLAAAIAPGVTAVLYPLALSISPLVVYASVAFMITVMIPVYNINAVSLRQAITPIALQGRMNATTRTIVWGTIPIGSFLGGVLGSTIGIVNTIYVGGVIAGSSALWILFGPVIRMKVQPEPIE